MAADGHDAEVQQPPRAHQPGREIRRLGSQTLIYGLGGVALQLVGIVTLPIFARVFSPADFGVIELATVLLAILMIVVDGGMASASQRSYFDHGDDGEAQRRRILVTALLFQLLLGALVALALAVFGDPVSRAMFDGREDTGMLVILGAMLPAFAAAQFTREILRLEFRAWSYLASSIAGAAVGGAISILAVVSWDAGVEGPFIGLLAGSLVSALYGLCSSWHVSSPGRRGASCTSCCASAFRSSRPRSRCGRCRSSTASCWPTSPTSTSSASTRSPPASPSRGPPRDRPGDRVLALSCPCSRAIPSARSTCGRGS